MNRVRREARPWFLGSSSDLGHNDREVPGGRVKLWRVVVAMK